MTPLHWGPLLPAVGYTAVFYSCPMQREEWFLAGMKWGAKSLRRAVSRVTCTAEVPVSASHQQPISILKVWHVPHPLPRQQQDFGHSWDACGLFLALCEGKKKITETESRACFCLPPLSSLWVTTRRVRGASERCGDTPSPAPKLGAPRSAHEWREGAPWRTWVMIFFPCITMWSSQKKHKARSPSLCFKPTFFSRRRNLGWRQHPKAAPHFCSPLPKLMLPDPCDCSVCATTPRRGDGGGPRNRSTSQTPLVRSQVLEGLKPMQGCKWSLITLHLQSWKVWKPWSNSQKMLLASVFL